MSRRTSYEQWRDSQIQGVAAPLGSENVNSFEFPRTVPCAICVEPTPRTGTKRCDICWEMERLIHRRPDLARKILAEMEK